MTMKNTPNIYFWEGKAYVWLLPETDPFKISLFIWTHCQKEHVILFGFMDGPF